MLLQVYHHLEPACNLREGQDYLLFKKGIRPNWEDPLNKQGGRLIVNMSSTRVREEGGLYSREEVVMFMRRQMGCFIYVLFLIGVVA